MERPDDIEVFCRQLSSYLDSSLRRIYEYYKDDLAYILENMDTGDLLRELQSRNVLNTDQYWTIKEGSGIVYFCHTLLQDIQDRGRRAVLGLWECLYAVKKDHPHPNLLAVLDEIRQKGEGLVNQILLDELGHSLTPELKVFVCFRQTTLATGPVCSRTSGHSFQGYLAYTTSFSKLAVPLVQTLSIWTHVI